MRRRGKRGRHSRKSSGGGLDALAPRHHCGGCAFRLDVGGQEGAAGFEDACHALGDAETGVEGALVTNYTCRGEGMEGLKRKGWKGRIGKEGSQSAQMAEP